MKNFIPLIISPLLLLTAPVVNADSDRNNTEWLSRTLNKERTELNTSDSFSYLKRFIKLESLSLSTWDESFTPTKSEASKSFCFVNNELITISSKPANTSQLSLLDFTTELNLNTTSRFSVAGELPGQREFRFESFERNNDIISVRQATRPARQLRFSERSILASKVFAFENSRVQSKTLIKPTIRRHFEHLQELFPKNHDCWLEESCSVFDTSVGFYNATQMNSVKLLLQDSPALHLHLSEKAAIAAGVHGGKLRLPLNKKKRS